MFSFFKNKVDYTKVFASVNETYKYIYGDTSKTSEILGDENFIQAWLDSKNIATITTIIKNEALKGDIPSINQMIWLSDIYFKDVENITRDRDQQLKLKVDYLNERIMFCEKAIGLGLKDKSYQAMISCANLYSLLERQKKAITDENTRTAVNGIIKYARLFIESGYNDLELIEDANKLIKIYSPISQLANSINTP